MVCRTANPLADRAQQARLTDRDQSTVRAGAQHRKARHARFRGGGETMRLYRRGLTTAAVIAVAISLTAAGGATKSSFPTSIALLNLNGYQFVSSYPLGFDKGNTFKQTYGSKTASYITEKGPFFGTNGSGIPYVAMPIAHKIFMVVWLFSDGTHNSFVYDLNNGVVSVVTNGKTGTPSLGTVKLIKTGAQPLP
jgi:hypothetical protein